MAGEPSTVEKKENSVAKFKLACTGVHLAQRFRPLNPSGVVSSKNGSLSTKPIKRRRLSLFLFGFCFLFLNLLGKKKKPKPQRLLHLWTRTDISAGALRVAQLRELRRPGGRFTCPTKEKGIFSVHVVHNMGICSCNVLSSLFAAPSPCDL